VRQLVLLGDAGRDDIRERDRASVTQRGARVGEIARARFHSKAGLTPPACQAGNPLEKGSRRVVGDNLARSRLIRRNSEVEGRKIAKIRKCRKCHSGTALTN